MVTAKLPDIITMMFENILSISVLIVNGRQERTEIQKIEYPENERAF